jgi:hypothetical protein
MNYPFLLKFSSITNLSDARYAAGMWADFVGFCFDPSSPDYIEPSKAKEITGWINGPLIVGEFGQQPLEWINDFIKGIPLHAIQVPAGYEDLSIHESGLPIILWVDEAAITPLMKFAKCLITDNPSLPDQLKLIIDLPVLFQSNAADYNQPIEQYSGIAFKGETEMESGTRNHDAWTSLLDKFMD